MRLYSSWQNGFWMEASFGYDLVGLKKKIGQFVRRITLAMEVERADFGSGESVATVWNTLVPVTGTSLF